jgi:ribosomal protein L37AE/L43A
MLNKLEKKFGKYAIPNLINYLIGGYIIGFFLEFGYVITGGNFDIINYMQLEPHYIIQNLQIWRLVTWVLIPPPIGSGMFSILFAVIMIYFYWQLGRILEQTIGVFQFNLYIFGGMLFTVIGSLIYYLINFYALGNLVSIGSQISTHYINLSIFLAFSLCYPNMEVMLYFLIPIKMKWMSIVYLVFIGFDLLISDWGGRVAILSSLLNFVIFFVSTRNLRRISPSEIKRKAAYQRGMQQGPYGKTTSSGGANTANRQIVRHKCSICGRTDVSNPELEFRYCSKCEGSFEYCNEHLFTHAHIHLEK